MRRNWIRAAALIGAGGGVAGVGGVCGAQCQTWDTGIGSPGAQQGDPVYGTAVRALEVFDAGTGPALYAAGVFGTMGGAVVNHVARWDGAQWHPLGAGLGAFAPFTPRVYDLQSFNDGGGGALYAAGVFDSAGGQPASGIARWNGSSWQGLSTFTNGTLYKMAVMNDGTGERLYLGGDFSEINGMPHRSLVRWTGQGWELVPGAPSFPGGGSAVWGFGQYVVGTYSSIFVGGLQLIPGVVINQVPHGSLVFRVQNGMSWQYPGYGLEGLQQGGVSAALTAMEVYDDGSGPKLYAGGMFTESGYTALSNFARFDGAQWSDVGGGVTSGVGFSTIETGPTVWDLTRHAGKLYLGGGFTQAGGQRALWLASWDGQAFQEPAGGTNDTVYDLQVFDDGSGPSIFVAGTFTKVDPTGAALPAGGIARLSCGSACYADCNASGSLSIADFACFQAKFASGDPSADCNSSGSLTIADFGCFQAKFAAGCP